jgi:hypothetical protein
VRHDLTSQFNANTGDQVIGRAFSQSHEGGDFREFDEAGTDFGIGGESVAGAFSVFKPSPRGSAAKRISSSRWSSLIYADVSDVSF